MLNLFKYYVNLNVYCFVIVVIQNFSYGGAEAIPLWARVTFKMLPPPPQKIDPSCVYFVRTQPIN